MGTTLRSSKPYITTVTNATWSCSADDGFTRISIINTPASTGNATVTGAGTASGVVGTGIVLTAGETFSDITDVNAAIELTVVAASGCTIQILAGG